MQKNKGGRPAKIKDAVVVSVRLHPEIAERIDEIVRNSGHFYRDRSEFVRQSIAVAVQKKRAKRPL